MFAILSFDNSGSKYPNAPAVAITLELAAVVIKLDRPKSVILAFVFSSSNTLLEVRFPCIFSCEYRYITSHEPCSMFAFVDSIDKFHGKRQKELQQYQNQILMHL
ncbi:hypothetical protein MtrunA17_Chr5g0437721 [Medicago truncatula]|uniref:Uncharacterized protein n=1 Tax=Medicago truncatula TaxID=3880 RepID=A0A396HV16_MEDTR|nr:hypothetical protein MtrunA17_Chr5g0437721 [Medicago truncatula]